MIKKYAIELKWGLILFAIGLLWMVIEKLAGWHGPRIDMHPKMTMLFFIPVIILYYLAIKEKRDVDFDGVMTWQQGLISGIVISIVVALFNPIQQLITHEYLSPEYFPNAIELSLEKNPNMTREEAESYFTLKSYIMQGTIGTLISGLLISALVSIFLKKKAD
jgi:uncharacterized membrane protein YraQ (UPF0718 family)